ncbi:hypothetical protein NQ315_017273 [Exocentrus adspersus]|uniref:Glutamate receptor 1 n=1 Tax=Exocentrus adspersus TaxID=1586481 RepID=A0AAV8VFS8_9CUCU|nr:hypothetical protein NQ315_017273 [Exocentrus adspersus]
MKIVLQNVLWLLSFVAYQYFCLENQAVTNIGVFFSDEKYQSEIALNTTIYKKNTVDQRANFKSTIKHVPADSFEASKILCETLNTDDGVAAVFGTESAASSILESICNQFDVPYMITSWRPPSFKKRHTVLNFFPEAELFAHALAEIVKSLQWNSFVIIYENEEGLIRMQEILKLQEYEQNSKQNNVLVKQLGSGPDHRSLLKEIKNLTENNIILDCKTENIIPILKQAKDQRLLTLYNNYFLTSLDAHTLDYSELGTEANITTIRIFDYNTTTFHHTIRRWGLLPFDYDGKVINLEADKIKTETVLFYDALLLLTDCINDLESSHTHNIATNPIDCYNENQIRSEFGLTISAYMKERKPSLTLSGPLKFDESGHRIDFNVHVVDVLDKKVIANWFASNNSLVLSRSSNETENAAVANLQKILVKVSSRLGEPYLMVKKAEEGEELYGNERYEGYSMDLIKEVAKLIGFKFEFFITSDGKYGNFDETKKKWTGLVGDLLEGRAHLAVCDLTITHQRREVVDFSMPFMTLGISILYRKEDKKEINMFAFLDPFSISVWIYTATLYLIISVVLFFISRMTPGDWENPHPCDENPEELENIWDIKNCLWLTLGSIMTQGCDILPKGISSRMAVSMWWFFSLIMTSSYTANLAAFLTKDRMEPSIDSAEDLSKQTKIKYGALQGGSTFAFFKDSNFSTYQKMWMSMSSARPSVFVQNNKDGVKKVQAPKENYAFLMESTQIEYEIETKCDLKQVGNWLDTKTYGIAMPMNSPYRSAINKAILKLQETGKLNELKNIWWKERRNEPSCDKKAEGEDNADGAELALANVGGVFFVLGVGIGIAFVLAIAEFLWNVKSVSVEEHMSYWEALKVEVKFACNVWITKKRTKPVASESSSSSSRKSDKIDNKSIVHSILHSAGSFMNLNN